MKRKWERMWEFNSINNENKRSIWKGGKADIGKAGKMPMDFSGIELNKICVNRGRT